MCRTLALASKLMSDQLGNRSVVAIEGDDVERWLQGSADDVTELLAPPAVELIEGGPV